MKRIYGLILAGIILLNGVFISNESFAREENNSSNAKTSANESSSKKKNNNNSDSDDNGSSNNQNNNTEKKESKPRLIIDNYTITPNPVKAGEEFDLKISFQNTNKNRTVKNIKVVLNSTGGTSTGETGGDSENTPARTLNGSVFMPVGSSNTFYIDSIGAGKKVSKTIKMTSPYDVRPNTYELSVLMEYEDSNNEEYKVEESLGINLYQEAKVQVGTMPVLEGESGVGMPFSVDLYNTGKSPVYNMMIKLSGDFASEGDTSYIGKFEPGSTETFSAEIMGSEAGEKEGLLTITYEDSTGQTHEVKQDFSMNMAEMNIEEEDLSESKPFYKSAAFWIILIILIGSCAAVVIIMRKRQKEQQDIDEEDLDIEDNDFNNFDENDYDLTQRINLEEFLEQENLNNEKNTEEAKNLDNNSELKEEDAEVEDDEKNED